VLPRHIFSDAHEIGPWGHGHAVADLPGQAHEAVGEVLAEGADDASVGTRLFSSRKQLTSSSTRSSSRRVRVATGFGLVRLIPTLTWVSLSSFETLSFWGGIQ
jgi:hypothetical protein